MTPAQTATLLNRLFLVTWTVFLGPVWLLGIGIQRAGKAIALVAAWPLNRMAAANRGEE